jgi:hypothetical protein
LVKLRERRKLNALDVKKLTKLIQSAKRAPVDRKSVDWRSFLYSAEKHVKKRKPERTGLPNAKIHGERTPKNAGGNKNGKFERIVGRCVQGRHDS